MLIFGDTHGRLNNYIELANKHGQSLHLGDVGFRYDDLLELHPDNHKCIGGNHENYERSSLYYFRKWPYFLGDYGTVPHIADSFYVRGAWSIDWEIREKSRAIGYQRSWWPEEELTTDRLEEAIQLYKQLKPNYMFSHECPFSVLPHVTNPAFVRNFGYYEPLIKTKTNQALQTMFDIHRPKLWFFGHYHINKKVQDGPTTFICVGEGQYYELDLG